MQPDARCAATRADGFEVIEADLSTPAGVAALISAVQGRTIDILVNNAGMSADHDFRNATPPDPAEADAGIFLNLNAPIHLITALMPMLRSRPEAMVVNVTSGLDLKIGRVTPQKVTSRYGDPQSEDITVYANAGLPLNDAWGLYGFSGYQKRKTDSAANPRLANNSNNVVSIWPNGFLPLITTDIDDLTGRYRRVFARINGVFFPLSGHRRSSACPQASIGTAERS